ncbi:hypothetical protein HanXRQr2_Chr08g0355991 [Helianthus annuus]|uniref:Uncharacterized protein n=1 Tax=Helianthus annuus TaxID=4232 RepID=A0A9K3NDS1_HELAN|nr:hypothetical protein HanXRQr2_Chr08g0355991 [Helianthus annuus]
MVSLTYQTGSNQKTLLLVTYSFIIVFGFNTNQFSYFSTTFITVTRLVCAYTEFHPHYTREFYRIKKRVMLILFMSIMM